MLSRHQLPRWGGEGASFLEVVTFYRAALRQKGDLVFDAPATHEFDIGRFREETMAFPPGVTVKDFQSQVWGLTKGTVKHLLMTQDAAPLLPYNSPNTSVTLVDVPAGSKVVRTATAAMLPTIWFSPDARRRS